jgi:acetyltransferase
MCAPVPVSALAIAADVQLDDARKVRIRPVECDDGRAVQAFVARLSPGTSRRRFFRPVKALTPSALARVVEVDYTRSMSIVAEAGGELVGLAEYVASPGEHSADVAVVIADEWQGAGLGRVLLGALLMHAANQGLARLRGEALADNAPILALTHRFGFSARPHPEERDLVALDRELAGPSRPKPCSTRRHEPAGPSQGRIPSARAARVVQRRRPQRRLRP